MACRAPRLYCPGPTGPTGAPGPAGPTGTVLGPTGATGATGTGASLQIAVFTRSAAVAPVGLNVVWNGPASYVGPPCCALDQTKTLVQFFQAGLYQVVVQSAPLRDGVSVSWLVQNRVVIADQNKVAFTNRAGDGVEVMLNLTYFFQIAARDTLALYKNSGGNPVGTLGTSQLQILKVD
jgi:hypothetical protein